MDTATLLERDIGYSSVFEVQLIKGPDVYEILTNEQFLTNWDKLYDRCPWSTVFQSRDFVTTWYSTFKDSYFPIIVKYESEGQLFGLLTMAIKNKNDGGKLFIVAAGHGEADCQTWLATASTSDQFIIEALRAILKEFPREDILIRHTPPDVPLNWTVNKEKGFGLVVESFTRPLLQLDGFSISKRNRKRVNRLEKLGKHVEVANYDEFSKLLEQLTLLYDFRQGAMFNRTPYRNNPAYSELLLSLYKKNVLKVSVLKVGNEIIAGLIVIVGKGIAHLGGINVHSPSFARYSPGYVQFLLMGQTLALQKIKYLDLTPGGDPYKDRIATTYDQVHTLTISRNSKFILKRQVRLMVHRWLLKTGVRPLSFQLFLERQKYLLKKRGGYSFLSNYIKAKFRKPVLIPYRIVISSTSSGIYQVSRNCISDLLSYRQSDSALTEWEFLESAMQNFEREYEVFTSLNQNDLAMAIWFRNFADEESAPELGRCIILKDLYATPSSVGNLPNFLNEVVAQLSELYKPEKIYYIDNSHQIKSWASYTSKIFAKEDNIQTESLLKLI